MNINELRKAFGNQIKPTKIIMKFIGLFLAINFTAFFTIPFGYQYLPKSIALILAYNPLTLTGLLIIWTFIKIYKLPNDKTSKESANDLRKD